MKFNNKNIIKRYLPILFLFLLLLKSHSLMNAAADDIENYKTFMAGSYNVIQYVHYYYLHWLPSVIPTIVSTYLMINDFWIWRVCDIIISIICILGLAKVFLLDEEKKRGLWIFCFLFLLYPMFDMYTAGWLSTTTRYIWTVAFMVISLLSIRYSYFGNVIPIGLKLIILLATAYATNVEQGAAILLPVYIVFGIYLYLHQKPYKLILLQLFVGFISMYYLLTCPGNKIRYYSEIKSWYPQYIDLNFFYKLYLGMTATIANRFFENLNWLYVFLIIGLIFAVKAKKGFSVCPSILSTIYLIPLIWQLKLWPQINGYLHVNINKIASTGNFELLNSTNYTKIESYFHIFVCFILIAAILYGIYIAFDEKYEKILFCLIFLAGFLSRVMIGLSPTIYASSTRTFIFFDFAIIIITAKLLLKYVLTEDFSIYNPSWCFICLISLLNYINFIRELMRIR